MQLRMQKPEKFRTSTGFEPVTSRHRCDALNQLTYEATDKTFRASTGSVVRLKDFNGVSGFTAQLVRASHRYRKVTGSNPVEVLNFSGFYIRNCLNCVHDCEDDSLFDFTSAVQYMKYFIYNFRIRFFNIIF